jgi:DNA polymerase-3 subunit delta
VILRRRDEIERFLKAPDPGVRAAVIYGPNRSLVGERADALAKRVTERPDDPFDVAVLTDSQIYSQQTALEGELAAISMMGGRRLVRLRMIASNNAGEKKSTEGQAAEAVTQHLAGAFNPEAFFLVEAGDIRNSALVRAGEKATNCRVIACYEDEASDTAQVIREGLSKDGLSLDAQAMDLFIARLPRERGVARQEVERLALYLGPGRQSQGTAAELQEFLGVEPEASLSEAALDAFGGRAGPAQSHLRRAAAEGETGPVAVRMMSLHLGRLRKALTLASNGSGLQAAAKASGVFWKTEQEFMRQMRVWTLAHLDTLQPDLLAADRACKQTGSPDRLIAERLALTIATRARRLGL